VRDQVIDYGFGRHHGEPVVLDSAVGAAVPPFGFGAFKHHFFQAILYAQHTRCFDGLCGHVFAGLVLEPF